MSVSLWKNYDSKSAYDGYLTEENKIRKHARIMTGILAVSYTHLTLPTI